MSKILLLLIFVLALAVPVYNHTGPEVFGVPFFYAYQLALVPLSSLLIGLVYLSDAKRHGDES